MKTGEFGKYSGTYQKVGDHYYHTAYFTDPLKVCDVTMTSQYSDVVGDRLVFLKGKGEYVTAPLLSEDADGTKWVQGKCFVSMGKVVLLQFNVVSIEDRLFKSQRTFRNNYKRC